MVGDRQRRLTKKGELNDIRSRKHIWLKPKPTTKTPPLWRAVSLDTIRDLQQRAIHHRSFGPAVGLLFTSAVAAPTARNNRRDCALPRGIAVFNAFKTAARAFASNPRPVLCDGCGLFG